MDRTFQLKCNADKSKPPLTSDELKKAMTEKYTTHFPQINRKFIDPPISGQQYALFSFIPHEHAVSGPNGIYGYAKIRGVYDTIDEANNQAENIIRYIDSTNTVFCMKTGCPFPIVTEGMSKEIFKVDLKQDYHDNMSTTISKNVRRKRDIEKNDIKQIEEREQKLKKDINDPDPIDDYTTKRVKHATLLFEIERQKKNILELIKSKDKCEEDLCNYHKSHPDFKNIYRKKLEDARAQAGIANEGLPGFMNYLDEGDKM